MRVALVDPRRRRPHRQRLRPRRRDRGLRSSDHRDRRHRHPGAGAGGRRRHRQGPGPGPGRRRRRLRARVGPPRLRVGVHALGCRAARRARPPRLRRRQAGRVRSSSARSAGWSTGSASIRSRRSTTPRWSSPASSSATARSCTTGWSWRAATARWQVVAYRLEPSTEDTPRPAPEPLTVVRDSRVPPHRRAQPAHGRRQGVAGARRRDPGGAGRPTRWRRCALPRSRSVDGASGLRAVRESPSGAGPLAALAAAGAALRARGLDGSGAGARRRPARRRRARCSRWLRDRPGAPTVVPRVDGRLQPVCARYGADALLAAESLVVGRRPFAPRAARRRRPRRDRRDASGRRWPTATPSSTSTPRPTPSGSACTCPGLA